MKTANFISIVELDYGASMAARVREKLSSSVTEVAFDEGMALLDNLLLEEGPAVAPGNFRTNSSCEEGELCLP